MSGTPGVPQTDIEAGARVICRASGIDPDQLVFQGPPEAVGWNVQVYKAPTDVRPAWSLYTGHALLILQDVKRREAAK